MGGKLSQLHYSPEDIALHYELALLETIGVNEIRSLLEKINTISFNYFLNEENFLELLSLTLHPFLQGMVHRW